MALKARVELRVDEGFALGLGVTVALTAEEAEVVRD